MKFLKSIPKVKLQKIIFVVILTAIGIGALMNFYISARLSDLSKERDRVTKLKTQIDLSESTMKSESQNVQMRDRLKTFVDAQHQKMVAGDPFSWIVREISLLAEKHPVRVTALRPGTKSSNLIRSRYDLFSTQIEVDGTYDQLGVFVRELENNYATGQIRTLDVTAPDPVRGVCRMAIELALVIQPAEVAKAASKSATEQKKAS